MKGVCKLLPTKYLSVEVSTTKNTYLIHFRWATFFSFLHGHDMYQGYMFTRGIIVTFNGVDKCIHLPMVERNIFSVCFIKELLQQKLNSFIIKYHSWLAHFFFINLTISLIPWYLDKQTPFTTSFVFACALFSVRKKHTMVKSFEYSYKKRNFSIWVEITRYNIVLFCFVWKFFCFMGGNRDCNELIKIQLLFDYYVIFCCRRKCVEKYALCKLHHVIKINRLSGD